MNKTTCVKTSCGNLFTWKKVLYKYTVREWRQNVLQNLLPFGNNLKKGLFPSFSFTSHRRAAKSAVVKKQTEREKERSS